MNDRPKQSLSSDVIFAYKNLVSKTDFFTIQKSVKSNLIIIGAMNISENK